MKRSFNHGRVASGWSKYNLICMPLHGAHGRYVAIIAYLPVIDACMCVHACVCACAQARVCVCERVHVRVLQYMALYMSVRENNKAYKNSHLCYYTLTYNSRALVLNGSRAKRTVFLPAAPCTCHTVQMPSIMLKTHVAHAYLLVHRNKHVLRFLDVEELVGKV